MLRFAAPKPYDWLSHRVAPYVWRTTCYLDTVDGTGEASHPNVLDMFERARSAGLGGAVVLKQRAEEGNNSFVVGASLSHLCPLTQSAPPRTQ